MTALIVLRPGPDLPEGFMPPEFDGLWLDKDQVMPAWPGTPPAGAFAVATGRYEYRPDGVRAEVYEVRQP